MRDKSDHIRSWSVAAIALTIAVLAAGCSSSTDTANGELAQAFATPQVGVAAPAASSTSAPVTAPSDVAAPGVSADGRTNPQPAPAGSPTTAPATSLDEAPNAGRVQTAPNGVELLRSVVVATYAHDPAAFTQGLELLDGQLIESTGARPVGDESELRRVEIETGAVSQRVDAPAEVFGEGVTLVGDQLVQITWQDQRAFFWDATTFELVREVSYTGQGWGICFDGERLIMTDGGTQLFFRDPETFEVIGQVTVTYLGSPLERLNELECVDGQVWANVWLTDVIVRVDPATGFVNGLVDASNLGQPRTEAMDVLNGIAWDPQTETFLVTGKFWPELYRVEFVPAG